MLILAFDTSTDYAVFALGDEFGTLMESIVYKHQRDLSQRFYDSLGVLLRNAGKDFGEVDAIAVGIGPGSFTGVRVAVTTAKTLAQVTGKKLIAVGTLSLYARDADPDRSRHLVAVLPSRKGELYAQSFQAGAQPAAPSVITFDALRSLLNESPQTTLCGQTASLPTSFSDVVSIEQFEPPATALIALAAECFKNRSFAKPLTLSPIYAAEPSISRRKSL